MVSCLYTSSVVCLLHTHLSCTKYYICMSKWYVIVIPWLQGYTVETTRTLRLRPRERAWFSNDKSIATVIYPTSLVSAPYVIHRYCVQPSNNLWQWLDIVLHSQKCSVAKKFCYGRILASFPGSHAPEWNIEHWSCPRAFILCSGEPGNEARHIFVTESVLQ